MLPPAGIIWEVLRDAQFPNCTYEEIREILNKKYILKYKMNSSISKTHPNKKIWNWVLNFTLNKEDVSQNLKKISIFKFGLQHWAWGGKWLQQMKSNQPPQNIKGWKSINNTAVQTFKSSIAKGKKGGGKKKMFSKKICFMIFMVLQDFHGFCDFGEAPFSC